MRVLINEVLPMQIAGKVLDGHKMAPEYFECVTIDFVDIMEFALLAASSTPNQILTLVNEFCTVFDTLVNKFDMYKVVTIGIVLYCILY